MKRILAVLIFFIGLLSCFKDANKPPRESGSFNKTDLVELSALDPAFKFDIRYATSNNFLKQQLYDDNRAFLQRQAAEALVRVQNKLKEKGCGIIILDAYRPWYVTKRVWDSLPKYRDFLADPAKGSRHNRGCAVDITLYNLKKGDEVKMPSVFDDFTEKASPDYKGGTNEERAARDLLRSAMESEGFTVYPNEWWHFDFAGWEKYKIQNIPISKIKTDNKP